MCCMFSSILNKASFKSSMPFPCKASLNTTEITAMATLYLFFSAICDNVFMLSIITLGSTPRHSLLTLLSKVSIETIMSSIKGRISEAISIFVKLVFIPIWAFSSFFNFFVISGNCLTKVGSPPPNQICFGANLIALSNISL